MQFLHNIVFCTNTKCYIVLDRNPKFLPIFRNAAHKKKDVLYHFLYIFKNNSVARYSSLLLYRRSSIKLVNQYREWLNVWIIDSYLLEIFKEGYWIVFNLQFCGLQNPIYWDFNESFHGFENISNSYLNGAITIAL